MPIIISQSKSLIQIIWSLSDLIMGACCVQNECRIAKIATLTTLQKYLIGSKVLWNAEKYAKDLFLSRNYLDVCSPVHFTGRCPHHRLHLHVTLPWESKQHNQEPFSHPCYSFFFRLPLGRRCKRLRAYTTRFRNSYSSLLPDHWTVLP